MTEAEELELLELEAQAAASNKPSAPTPSADIDSPSALIEALKSTGSAAMTGLGYLGGLGKTALFSPGINLIKAASDPSPKTLTDVLKLGEGVVGETLSDVGRAIKASAPSGQEYLKRVGAGEAVQKYAGPVIDLTGEMAGEVGLLKAGGALAKKAGKSFFKSAFSEADEIAEAAGKTLLPSEVAFNRGISGTEKQVKKQVQAAVGDLGEKRKVLIDMVDDTGAEADLDRAATSVRETIAKWKQAGRGSGNIEKAKAAEAFEQRLEEAIGFAKRQADNQPGVGLAGALDMKTSAYNKTGSDIWKDFAKTSEGKELQKQWALGLKEETERLANQVIPGAGDELKMINEEMGALLTPKNVWGKEALKEARKKGVTQVDAVVAGVDPALYLAKQGAKAAMSSYGKTKGGKAIFNLGKAAQASSPVGFGVPLLDMYLKEEQ